jgi:hypothetical protein
MSASSAQQSSLAVAVGVTTTESAEVPLRATEAQTAQTPTAPPSIATTAAPPVAAAPPSWRLATAGYLLLILATALVRIIPWLHLRSAFAEAALVLLSIVALVSGAALATACFIRNVIRML